MTTDNVTNQSAPHLAWVLRSDGIWAEFHRDYTPIQRERLRHYYRKYPDISRDDGTEHAVWAECQMNALALAAYPGEVIKDCDAGE